MSYGRASNAKHNAPVPPPARLVGEPSHNAPQGRGFATALFSVVEAVGGWWSGSLALLSDAGHMVTDALALGLALFAQTVARRPPSHRNSFVTPPPRPRDRHAREH